MLGLNLSASCNWMEVKSLLPEVLQFTFSVKEKKKKRGVGQWRFPKGTTVTEVYD